MVVSKNEDNKKLYDIIDGTSNERPPSSCSCMSWQANKTRKTSKKQENIYTKRGRELKLEVAPQNQSFFKTLLEAAEKENISHCEKDADTEGKQNLFEVLKRHLGQNQQIE